METSKISSYILRTSVAFGALRLVSCTTSVEEPEGAEPTDWSKVDEYHMRAEPTDWSKVDEYHMRAQVNAQGETTISEVEFASGAEEANAEGSLSQAFTLTDEEKAQKAEEISADAPKVGKLNAALAVRAASADPDEVLDVMFTVRHDAPFEHLPRLDSSEPRDSDSNVRQLHEREARFQEIESLRKTSRHGALETLSRAGGLLVEEHAMGNAVTARIPASKVVDLAADPSVRSISLRYDKSPPPTILNGRTALNTDGWFNAGWDGDVQSLYVGLIDTGVLSTHQVFFGGGGGTFGLHGDCAYGNASCANSPANANYNDQDPYWSHGTSSANSIMGAVSAWGGNNFRGVTRAILDYVNVWTHASASPQLDANAVLRGFSHLAAIGDHIIVVELQSQQDPDDPISLAADDAFDAGIAVIGALGNSGQVTNESAPGNAHKALSIGGYNATTFVTAEQINGSLTADSRRKPDIQGPTIVQSAASTINDVTGGTVSTTALDSVFGGTSAATAFTGGALALMYDWFESTFTTEPGQLYTGLLVMGNGGDGGGLDVGNGQLRFTGSCNDWWSGAVTFNNANAITKPIGMPVSRKDLRVVIWWPEDEGESHNDIDLQVLRPNATSAGTSVFGGSVWERVRDSGNLASGTWTIKMTPTSGSRWPQKVYYTAVAACQ
jgi:Subtilase family